jgi:hypothetical protein
VALENRFAAREHGGGAGARRGERGKTLRAGLLFWVLLLFAVGFARYFVLAQRDGDGGLAAAAAVAFLMMCALAAAEAFGWLW